MAQNRNRKGWGWAAGTFALGAALGSGLALLFAPAAGRTLRRRIGMKLRGLEREASRQLSRTRKQLVRKVGDLREVAQEKIADTRQWLKARANGKHPVKERQSMVAHRA